MQRQQLSSETFEQRREEEAPWLAVFVAGWCQPCDLLLSRLSAMTPAAGRDLPVGVVDVEREPELAERYGVKGMPTLVLFVEGEPRTTRVGALSEAQLETLCDEAARG